MFAAFRAPAVLVLMLAVFFGTVQPVCAQTESAGLTPVVESRGPVQVDAAFQETWQQGTSTVIAFIGADAGNLAQLSQGDVTLRGERIVLIDTPVSDGHRIDVYAEGRVVLRQDNQSRNYVSHTLQLASEDAARVRTATGAEIDEPSVLMNRAMQRFTPVQEATAAPVTLQAQPEPYAPPRLPPISQAVTELSRKVQIRPRSNQPLQFNSSISRDTVPEEQVYEITGGVRVLIEGVELDAFGRFLSPGVLDLSADSVVVWMQPEDAQSLNDSGGTVVQSASNRFQIYLEGNILVKQDQNTVTASHAFYDANNDRALLLNAELRAYLPQTGGTFRVRSERLRQLSRQRFHAQNAWTTTSPYGKPGYRLQATDVFVEPGPAVPFFYYTNADGESKSADAQPLWVTSLNTQFMVGDTPVLWLPRMTAPAEDPNIPIRRAVVKHDRIFGLQVKTVWDLTKILGQPKQRGMQWDLLADYLTERGPAVGVQGKYDIRNQSGRALGNASIIYQYDSDVDVLGLDRRSVVPDHKNRGQVIWRHKQELPGNTTVFGEIGYLSDRNYRESFHEPQWDTEKDAETLLGVRQDYDTWSGMLWGRTELNEFESSTDWLPRGDLYNFSQPLLGGAAYWSSHSSVGYADLEPGDPPRDLTTDPFAPGGLPYYADSSGLVAMTRHQLDAPFMVGPVNVKPFVMGEAAFWDEGLMGQDIDRLVGSGGVQAHLTATKLMPFVRSELWNLNGLAHKADTYLEYRITDSTRDLSEISQYNEIDDNATERFRTRYAHPTQIYPGMIPAEFDPRFYAVRNGAGLWIAAPYHELVDDQQTLRLRFRNRLQTKVGPAGSQRIRDWMVWEAGATWFPDPNRDNFGEDFGLLYSAYRWNINDRTSILADGTLDLFENAQNVWSAGVLSQRSMRGSVYVGIRQVEAKNFLDSQTLVASYSYQMSPKWISTGSFAYDLAESESRGSSLTFSRVGLDWIFHFGFGIDTSKDNVGLAFALEPRFGPPSPTNLSYLLGLQR